MSVPTSRTPAAPQRQDSTPVFLPTSTEDIFAIFTRPASEPNGIAVLVLPGGGGEPTFGKNQVRRRLAGALAARGFHVLRIDYRGVAESGGAMRKVDFEDPWTEDALTAVRWLESQGFARIAIIGQCFGGRTALASADKVSGLMGLALVAPPIRDVTHGEAILRRPLSWYVKKAASPRSAARLVGGRGAQRRRNTIKARLQRVITPDRTARPAGTSAVFLDALQAVLRRRIPVLFLYGSSDEFYPDFDFVRAGPMARIMESSGDLVTMQLVDARFGGMQTVPTQDIFVSNLVSWLDAVVHKNSAVAGNRS